MKRRMFSLLFFTIPTALLAKSSRGVTVRLTNLDPRFVEQQQIAANSRELTLEQWFVHCAVMMSGYTLNKGFIKEDQ